MHNNPIESRYAFEILMGLNNKHEHKHKRVSMYAGTANPRAVERRRARNKVARRSRRINRGA